MQIQKARSCPVDATDWGVSLSLLSCISCPSLASSRGFSSRFLPVYTNYVGEPINRSKDNPPPHVTAVRVTSKNKNKTNNKNKNINGDQNREQKQNRQQQKQNKRTSTRTKSNIEQNPTQNKNKNNGKRKHVTSKEQRGMLLTAPTFTISSNPTRMMKCCGP